MQDFKYQMINKFSLIDNASLISKKYTDMRGEILFDHVLRLRLGQMAERLREA